MFNMYICDGIHKINKKMLRNLYMARSLEEIDEDYMEWNIGHTKSYVDIANSLAFDSNRR